MNAFVAAGAGFLFAVLWFDLMFDVQVLGHRRGELPRDVLDSLTRYYGRVTVAARTMSLLIAAVMLGTLAAVVIQLAGDEAPNWVSISSLALGAPAIGLALTVTVPHAVRLGERRDDAAGQTRLARSLLRDHVLCLAAIAGVIVIQLGFG